MKREKLNVQDQGSHTKFRMREGDWIEIFAGGIELQVYFYGKGEAENICRNEGDLVVNAKGVEIVFAQPVGGVS